MDTCWAHIEVTFRMYPRCDWWIHWGKNDPEPAMYPRCSHWFPGHLAPSVERSPSCDRMKTQGSAALGIWVRLLRMYEDLLDYRLDLRHPGTLHEAFLTFPLSFRSPKASNRRSSPTPHPTSSKRFPSIPLSLPTLPDDSYNCPNDLLSSGPAWPIKIFCFADLAAIR